MIAINTSDLHFVIISEITKLFIQWLGCKDNVIFVVKQFLKFNFVYSLKNNCRPRNLDVGF